MDRLPTDIEHLAARLEPVLAAILNKGGAFVEELGGEISKKASGGLVTTAVNAIQAIGKAGWKTVRSSRANKRFRSRWDAASSEEERQKAIRQLLAEDPRQAVSLRGLLLRFDFLRAVIEHAEQLPNISLLNSARRLSEVYVPLAIEPAENTSPPSPPTDRSTIESRSRGYERGAADLLSSGNHLVEGVPGSGKSTLARWLAVSNARNLLGTGKVAFDLARMPLLISARSLQGTGRDFTSALRDAVASEMAVTNFAAFPNEFFLPYSDGGHKQWLVVLDGLDEVEDRHERQRLWDAVLELHSRVGDAFRFVVFTRPNSIRIFEARNPSVDDRRALARLLAELGDNVRATRVLESIDGAEEKDGYLGPWDETVIKNLRGEEQLMKILALRAAGTTEELIDRLFHARDMASRYGDRQALELIVQTAHDRNTNANDRLQAVEFMDELGYRGLPLELLPDILATPEIDDYWAGDLLLRFGRKAEALGHFRKAIRSCPADYRDQIARRLADLQATSLLAELDQTTA